MPAAGNLTFSRTLNSGAFRNHEVSKSAVERALNRVECQHAGKRRQGNEGMYVEQGTKIPLKPYTICINLC